MKLLGVLVVSLITVLIIIGIALFIRINKEYLQEQQTEGFYDIAPAELHWNIFKCLDPKCIKEKSYECYKWCDNWEEPGGAENCRLRCGDYADEMFDSLKFQNYTFNYLLPRFDAVTLLKDRDDIVEWNTKDYFPPIHEKQYSRQYNGYFNRIKKPKINSKIIKQQSKTKPLT